MEPTTNQIYGDFVYNSNVVHFQLQMVSNVRPNREERPFQVSPQFNVTVTDMRLERDKK